MLIYNKYNQNNFFDEFHQKYSNFCVTVSFQKYTKFGKNFDLLVIRKYEDYIFKITFVIKREGIKWKDPGDMNVDNDIKLISVGDFTSQVNSKYGTFHLLTKHHKQTWILFYWFSSILSTIIFEEQQLSSLENSFLERRRLSITKITSYRSSKFHRKLKSRCPIIQKSTQIVN